MKSLKTILSIILLIAISKSFARVYDLKTVSPDEKNYYSVDDFYDANGNFSKIVLTKFSTNSSANPIKKLDFKPSDSLRFYIVSNNLGVMVGKTAVKTIDLMKMTVTSSISYSKDLVPHVTREGVFLVDYLNARGPNEYVEFLDNSDKISKFDSYRFPDLKKSYSRDFAATTDKALVKVESLEDKSSRIIPKTVYFYTVERSDKGVEFKNLTNIITGEIINGSSFFIANFSPSIIDNVFEWISMKYNRNLNLIIGSYGDLVSGSSHSLNLYRFDTKEIEEIHFPSASYDDGRGGCFLKAELVYFPQPTLVASCQYEMSESTESMAELWVNLVTGKMEMQSTLYLGGDSIHSTFTTRRKDNSQLSLYSIVNKDDRDTSLSLDFFVDGVYKSSQSINGFLLKKTKHCLLVTETEENFQELKVISAKSGKIIKKMNLSSLNNTGAQLWKSPSIASTQLSTVDEYSELVTASGDSLVVQERVNCYQ